MCVCFLFGGCISVGFGNCVPVFLDNCVLFFFSLMGSVFGLCVSVLGLRFSVSLFCFHRPQYKLNRCSVASKSNH